MELKKYRKYTPEFRQRALALAKELGNGNEAARKLGIPRYTLQEWIQKERAQSRGKTPSPELPAEERLRQLERENEQLKKANYILKQAAAFFSQDHLN